MGHCDRLAVVDGNDADITGLKSRILGRISSGERV